MKTRLVGMGVIALALAGGATALALTQPARSAAPAAVAANSGRAVVEHRDDDGDDDEVVITLGDLPAAVRTSLAGSTADSAVTEVSRETKRDGSTTYDVEYTKDGVKWSAEFSSDGRVLENEQDDEDD